MKESLARGSDADLFYSFSDGHSSAVSGRRAPSILGTENGEARHQAVLDEQRH